jgi:hypothetical protein
MFLTSYSYGMIGRLVVKLHSQMTFSELFYTMRWDNRNYQVSVSCLVIHLVRFLNYCLKIIAIYDNNETG